MDTQSAWKAAISTGLHAARRNLIPGLVIWALAAGILIAWHAWPAATRAMTALSVFKDAWSYPFAFCSTALAGGLIPALILRLVTGDPSYTGRQLPWLIGFWACKGLEVNGLYELQAMIFGTGSDPATLAIKVLADQFVYVPIWAVPTMVLGYAWIEGGRGRVAATWRRGYARAMLPMLLANGALWIPTVTIIYALDTPLQLPIQNLVLCFWSLMVALIASPTDDDVAQDQTAVDAADHPPCA